MNLAAVLAHLRQRIGLNPETLGPSAVAAAVAERLKALNLNGPTAYELRLAQDPEEFQTLVDRLVVPESWFFRGGEVFAFLARHIREVSLNRPLEKPFRCLSVPCSTGEEPYSLAIALTERAVPSTAWTINGVDLSSRHIERARAGRYNDFSFRQVPAGLRDSYFRSTDGKWQLRDDIRQAVRFRVGNLAEPHFLAGERPFDLILCRNLLIYFHVPARQQVLATIERLLGPEGLLGVGPAESLNPANPRFERFGPDRLFLYRRRSADEGLDKVEKGKDAAFLISPPAAPRTLAAQESMISTPVVVRNIEAPRAVEAERPFLLLSQARDLADAGNLVEALAICQDHLQRAGPSAEAFSLLGVIHQANGDAGEAARCFQKALYLQPDNPEALHHWLLACEQQGDRARAEALRRRLERVHAGGEA